MKSRGNDLKGESVKERERTQLSDSALGRRDLMKIGAGAIITTLAGQAAVAHAAEETKAAESKVTAAGEASRQPRAAAATADFDWKSVRSGPGYKNDANRLSGNGPMDNTSRQLVEYTTGFSEANLTPNFLPGINTTMIDCMAAIITGFESEPGRIGAKYGQMIQSNMKSTIFGYGIVTSPEAATLANSMAMRDADWVHSPDMVPGILAIGEALHKSGPEVLTAIALGMEVVSALQQAEGTGHPDMQLNRKWDEKYDGAAAALAAGKLLGLDEDRLANALSMSLVPQMPLFVSHVGALSHFKSCHAPWSVRAGISAAIMASLGLTGPAPPFEARGGLWDSLTTPFKGLNLPVNPGRLRAAEGIEYGNYKRYPTDGRNQAIVAEAVPAIRSWAKADDIESIHVDTGFDGWTENASPPKWDPRNRETADHSLPYVLSYGLIYGDVFLEAFTPKHFIEDAAVRQLMSKITVSGTPDPAFSKMDRSHFTVRKKSGEQMEKDIFEMKPMTHDEVITKFKRVCDYKGMATEQRDRALDTWGNLMKARDIADPIRELAKFGKPLPL